MDRTPLIGADHLDLLVTAAIQYRQLISPTTAAFSPAGSTRATAASPREAGQLLLEENLAAARWRVSRGRDRAPLQLLEYSFRPVLTPWTAVEVIKAVHAYQHDTADSPGWSGSAAHHLTGSIERAATQHLPGYAQAPWTWRRPSVLEQPVGLHGAWAPVVPQVRWGDVDDVLTRWMHTAVVVITLEALELLPAQLAPRGGPTFVLAQSSQGQPRVGPARTRSRRGTGRASPGRRLAGPAARPRGAGGRTRAVSPQRPAEPAGGILDCSLSAPADPRSRCTTVGSR
jgi:hypothetical protein